MWKILPRFSRRIFSLTFCKQHVSKSRYFMSNSFSLQEEWDKRLKSPILSKIIVNDMHYELENQFNLFASASALDIDLFANSVVDQSNVDEVEDIILKLRLTPESVNMLPSTHHAFIRLYLRLNNSDELLRILNDRLNYGIFPDDYCSMLMIDTFLKNNNFRDATKVAVLHMLQEDFSNPIIKFMSLYSCLKYLENPSTWELETQEEVKPDDDEEEIKVRVDFIRNPFFDDHFDLVDPYHLIGKTLINIGHEMPDILGRTCQLIGYGLYNKWDNLKRLILSYLSSDEKEIVFKDGITLLTNHLDNLQMKEDVKTQFEATRQEIKEMFGRLESSGKISQDNLLKITEERLKKIIQEREQVEIEQQSKTYNEWEAVRAKLLQDQIKKLEKEKQLAQIKEEKEKLKKKEEELFFFNNEHKIDLTIERKYERPRTKTYDRVKKKPRTSEEVYIPPEVGRTA